MPNFSSIRSIFTKQLLVCCFQVLGEYSQLTTLPDLPEICRCLLDWYHRANTTAKLHILSAFTKLLLAAGDTSEHVLSRLAESNEDSVQVKQVSSLCFANF